MDPNHLIMEAGGADREAFLNDPNIDVISDHLYEYWNIGMLEYWNNGLTTKDVELATLSVQIVF